MTLVKFVFLISIFLTKAQAFTLHFDLSNIKNENGYIRYLLFNKAEGYPDDEKMSIGQGSLKVVDAQKGIILKNIEGGQYSFTLIHDENNNNVLDTNILGIPKEGFGFSNNPKIFFGAPSFSKCSFEVKGDMTLNIEMKYF